MLLVISVQKISVNGQFYFNLSLKTWSHVFLEHSEYVDQKVFFQLYTTSQQQKVHTRKCFSTLYNESATKSA